MGSSSSSELSSLRREVESLKQKNKNIENELKQSKERSEDIEKKTKEEKEKLENQQKNAKEDFLQQSKDINERYLQNIKDKLSQDVDHYFTSKKDTFPIEELRKKVSIFKTYENIEKKTSEAIKDSVDTIDYLQYKSQMNHFNILVLGQTGVGKSTLINSVLKLPAEEEAQTGTGKPITQGIKDYESSSVKGLRLWDSRGIELKDYGIDAVEKSTYELIQKQISLKDPDQFIHCIWYCVSGDRIQDSERDLLLRLMNTYQDSILPIIVVYTKSTDSEKTKQMSKTINEMFSGDKKVDVVPVLAKEIVIKIEQSNEEDSEEEDEEAKTPGEVKEQIIKATGIKKLLKKSFEKAEKAVQSAYFDSVKQIIMTTYKDKFSKKVNELKNATHEELNIKLDEISKEIEVTEKINRISQLIQDTLSKIINQKPQQLSQPTIDSLIHYFSKLLLPWYNSSITSFISSYIEPKANELKNLNNNELIEINNKYGVFFCLTENSYNYCYNYIKNGIVQEIEKELFEKTSKYLCELLINNITELILSVIDKAINDLSGFFYSKTENNMKEIINHLHLLSGYKIVKKEEKKDNGEIKK